MASSSPQHFSTVFLIALFISSLAHARESQYFSKATKDTTTQQVPNKEQQQQEVFTNDGQPNTLTKQQYQQLVDDPNFIPQTTPNSYGLYGHEVGQLPPSANNVEGHQPYRTTTSTVPDESLYSNYDQNNENYEQYRNNGENSYYYNKDSYVTEEERAGAMGDRYTTTSDTLADRNTYYGGGNSYGNVKQEGMSDTRFMENGKYFYDINNEEKYNPNYRYKYRYGDSRTTSLRNGEYNPNMMNGGYYGNKYMSQNYEYNGNSMEGYGQNQEFEEVQDEFVP